MVRADTETDTNKEMYIDYQPWITLIYISIFISPFIATLFI